MRQLLLFLFLFYACSSMAQIDLTVLPKAERDSTLVRIAQNFLLRKFPDRYRTDIIPAFGEGDFNAFGTKWLSEVTNLAEHVPSYVKPDDVWYEVILYYKDWEKANWNAPYTVRARIVGRTGELYEVWFGMSGYVFPEIDKLPDAVRRKKGLKKDERDRILAEIARKTVKEKWTELYREPTIPVIEQYDFSARGLDWMLQDFAVPDYVSPDDIYYVVTLWYEDWKKEEDFFLRPYIAKVYIVGKTLEAYKIESGAFGDVIRSLIKPRPEM